MPDEEPNMMRCSRPITATLAVFGAASALVAAGCGGGGTSPGVANIASQTTTATTTSQAPSVLGSGPGPAPKSGGGNAHFQIAMKVPNGTLGAKFSSCMRKHGVQNFPDPNSQGVIQFGSSNGIDPNSPTFRSARDACQKLLPNGGRPTPAQQAKMQQQLLAFARCMRAHGVKDFPDPSGGGLQLKGGPGSDLNPNNPQFNAAQKACQGVLPLKIATARGGATKSGG